MKFSRSILIFLFLSSLAGAFIWAMRKTNGNLLKSLQFTFVVLAFKMGLIGSNNLLESNQSDSNRQLAGSVNKVESPRYHPYLSVENDYRPSGLFMDSIERSSLVPGYSYSQNVINELRAGNRRVREVAWFLITIWMLQHQGVGFQPIRPIARPPHIEAAHNLLFGKPKSDGQSRLHLPNSKEVSTNVLPTQIQAANFVKDGKVDLQRAFDEVNRRAAMINCGNFDCSFERFKGLATECGNSTPSIIREAITILEGEMRGYYKNARREDYGPNVTGIDFVVEGLGKFDNITHVEVKGAVSSSIQPKPTLVKQAKKSVERVKYQKDFWSNKTKVNLVIPHIKPDANLPKSPDNVLALYDLWDVGTPEKSTVSNAITSFSVNDTNFVILNNQTNT